MLSEPLVVVARIAAAFDELCGELCASRFFRVYNENS